MMNIEAALKRLEKMKEELERLGCKVEIKVSIERPDYQQEYLYADSTLRERERELNELRDFLEEVGIPYSSHMSFGDVQEIKIKLAKERLSNHRATLAQMTSGESESEDVQ